MALTAELEDLIKELEAVDPTAAKAQRALLEQYPVLQKPTQEQRLRQSDYSKKNTELDDARAKFKEHDEWYKQAKPAFDVMKTERDTAVEENAKLKTEQDKKVKEAVAAATAAAGGDPDNPATADKITEAVLAKLGDGASPAKIAEVVAAEVKKFGAEQSKAFFETTFPKAARWQANFTSAQLTYYNETKEILDTEKFSKFMTDNKIEDPLKGLEEFMKPIREKKEIDAKVEARFQEVLKERSQEGVPGASGTPSLPGPMQIRLGKRDPNDSLFSGKGELGDNSGAAAAAAELTAEGKR